MRTIANASSTNAPMRVGVIGATGAVGQEIVKCLERRRFPIGELRLLASTRSAGSTIDFRGERKIVDVLTPDSLDGLDLVLSSASSVVALKFAPIAVRAGR